MPVLLAGVSSARPVAAVSALTELGSALHVLNEPVHHDAQDWASRIRTSMDADLAVRADRWAWATRAIRVTPFVDVCTTSGDFADEIDVLRSRDPADVARDLLRPVAPRGDREAAQRWARTREPAAAERIDALVTNPAAAVEEFVDFLESSWRTWFAAEWSRLRPGLLSRRRRFSDVVDKHGARAAVTDLDPAITADDSDAVSIAKVRNRRHDIARRGLVCVPSTFIHPHLYVADVPGRPLLLIHADGWGSAGPTPTVADMTATLDAAANSGRLEVARAIATEPRTAGEIAALWDMDATLVNRHLRTLAAGRTRAHHATGAVRELRAR